MAESTFQDLGIRLEEHPLLPGCVPHVDVQDSRPSVFSQRRRAAGGGECGK